MAIPLPHENIWRCSLKEVQLLTLVVPDMYSDERTPVFLLKTSLLSPKGELEYRNAQSFSYFQKCSNAIGKWVKDVNETECPFLYIESKGAIYATLEDALKGLPKNYLTVV